MEQLLTEAARDEEQTRASRDAYSRLAQRPEAMIQRAIADARSLLDGPAIQARCLECPSIAPPPRLTASDSFWARLISILWRA
jgi:protease-4